MCTFIEDYLQNPSEAIASAAGKAGTILWADSIDEDQIYQQIGTGSFRLYEELLDFSYLCTYDRYNDNDNNGCSASDSSADLSYRGAGLS